MSASNGNGHNNQTLAMAFKLRDGGISFVPTGANKLPKFDLLPRNEDGNSTWKPFQTRFPNDDELQRWFGGDMPRAGLAVVHGAVSANLETIDFDEDAEWVFPQWYSVVEAQAPGLLAKLIQVRTPRPGIQIRYRCVDPVEGNQDLAFSDKTDDEGKRKVRIETRGEGGYAVHPGTLAKFHPANRCYEQIAGPPLWEPAVITSAERDILLNAARAFDVTPYEPENERKVGDSKYEVTPWDDFNARTNWQQVLADHGWNQVKGGGTVDYWRHSSATGAWSATVNYAGNDLLHNFSTNSGLPLKKSMTRFAFVVFLDFRGDFRRAAEEMLAKGYGKLKPNQNRNGHHQQHKQPEAPPAWGAPKPLPSGIPVVPAFDPELLPVSFVPWLRDVSERTQAPIDYSACAAMVSLSAVVGRKVGIRPKRHDDWTVVPNLWGQAIGPPGVMKSQAIQEAFRPLTRLEIDAQKRHEADMKDFAAQELIAAARKKQAGKAIDKALQGGDPGRAHELAQQAASEELIPPARRRYLLSDATVEKLGEILAANPGGVAVCRDELAGLLRSLDREGQECSRAFYLEAWNGDGRFTYDRIGRGTITIENICISLFGSIQPGPLGEYQRAAIRNGSEADGLLQRFQLSTWPDVPKEWRNVDRFPDSDAKSLAYSVYTTLDGLAPEMVGATRDELDPEGMPFVRFDSQAQSVFDTWRTELEHKLRNGADHPAITSHLAKYRSLVPSLALLIWLAEAPSEPTVNLPALARALRWAEYLESHARRIFAVASGHDNEGARSIADKIREGILHDGFTAREIQRHCWSGLQTAEDVDSALGLLVDLDWLRERQEKTGGRPKVTYEINPRLKRTPPAG